MKPHAFYGIGLNRISYGKTGSAAMQNVTRFWPAIQQKVEGRQVGDKIAPQLRIHVRRDVKKPQLDSFTPELVDSKIFLGRLLGEIDRSPHCFADIDQHLVTTCLDPEIRQ